MKESRFNSLRALVCFLAFSFGIGSLFLSCSDDMKSSLSNDFSSSYTFFALSPEEDSNAESVVIAYPIGTELTKASLPTVADDRFAALNPGYSIDGWLYFKNPLNNSYDIPSTITFDEDDVISSILVTSYPAFLYASSWTAVNYTLVLDANGGSSESDGITRTQMMQNFVYDEAQALSPNIFSRNGYAFNGWNTAANRNKTTPDYADGEEVSNLATKEGAVVTLYACWIKESISLSFDANGGTGSMESISAQVDDTLPANQFTRTGYSFAGWNTSADGSGSSFSDEAVLYESIYPNQNTTLYAQWQKNTYRVTYYANNGRYTPYVETYEYDTTVTVVDGSTIEEFETLGYDFVSWNTSADGSGTTYKSGDTFIIDENGMTLYAQWTSQTLTIIFNSNGGSGTMDSQTVLFEDLPVTLNANTFTRTGYHFEKWSLSSSETGTTFADEASFTSSSWTAGSLILYAIWAHRLTIIGSVTSGLSLKYGDTTFTFSVPSGYSSYRWFIDGTEVTDNTTYTITLNYDDFAGDSSISHSIVAIVSEYNSSLATDVPVVYSASFHVSEE